MLNILTSYCYSAKPVEYETIAIDQTKYETIAKLSVVWVWIWSGSGPESGSGLDLVWVWSGSPNHLRMTPTSHVPSWKWLLPVKMKIVERGVALRGCGI